MNSKKKKLIENKENITRAIHELKKTKLMQEYYDKKWLEQLKKNYDKMDSDERFLFLFKED